MRVRLALNPFHLGVNLSIRSLIALVLTSVTFVSCSERAKETGPAPQLQVEPIQSTYTYYDSRSGVFRMGNGSVERRLLMDRSANRIFTIAFINKLSGRNYVKSPGEEFSFRANGVKLSGMTGDFKYMDHEISGLGDSRILEIRLRAEKEDFGALDVKLIYEMYGHIPVIRKRIEVENLGGSSVTLNSIQIESLSLLPGGEYDLKIYNSLQSATAFDGGVVVFDARLSEGFFIGTEVPGVLKHLDLYSSGTSLSVGMKPYPQSYALEIQLAPKEKFISPAVFIFLFKDSFEQSKDLLLEFIAEYLTFSKTPKYSLWCEEVGPDMKEQQIFEKVQLAKRSGAEIFCLGGIQTDKGEDQITEIQKLSLYVHDLGMKFGLCIDLTAADPGSTVLEEHPQWVVKCKDGSDYATSNGRKIMCLGSEYALYIAYEIDALIKELNLDYVKLTGPMIPDAETGGCFAKDHIHHSSAESLLFLYDGLFSVIKYLHSQHKDLIVDVSLESYNPPGMVDLALLEHADVQWPF